jgi:hypothetical protein
MYRRLLATSLRGVAITIVLVALLAGCSGTQPKGSGSAPETSAPSGYQLPTNVHYTNHWLPTPAVDLMSTDGTFIRAFAEADTLRLFNIDEKKGSYPGFAKADGTQNRLSGGGGDWYGYAVHWIVSLGTQPDGSAAARVCEATSITPDGTIHEGLSSKTLVYRREGIAPPANQHGPAPAPAVSVFGDWYATTYGAAYPITAETLAQCQQSKPTTDQNTDNSPGWPVAAQ